LFAVVPALVLLVGLGVWQLQRLAWKQGLIASIAAGEAAAPVPLPATITDAKALAFRFGLPLVCYGHSAGGHLAACMLATDWRLVLADLPQNVVEAGYGISGLYNLKPLTETTINTALGLSFEEAESQSPFFWPAPSRLSFDAVVGGEESEEYLRQSRRLVDVWGLESVITRYKEIPGANHFTAIAPLADPSSAMTARIAALCGA
jgi:arylformamidase